MIRGMPNRYRLVESKGALKLERRFEPPLNGVALPPTGGGGSRAGLPGPSTKGRVSLQWSRRSRNKMRFDFSALPWEMLGARPAMITLTYPGEWELWVPDSRTLARHREAFKERWRRKYGNPIGVWVVEFQKRGAPHLHIYVGLPDAVSDQEYTKLQERTIRRRHKEGNLGSYEARKSMRAPSGEFAMWLRTTWWEIVGSELRAHHGRGVDIATAFFSDEAERGANRARVAEYFWRESGKWAQKRAPEDFGSLKFYGMWGQKQGFKPDPTYEELSEPAALELRRVMRHMMRRRLEAQYQRYGRKPPRGAGRSRGRDGLTVFDINGEEWGPLLKAWAEICAADKAAERAGVERVTMWRGLPSLRSLSERPLIPSDREPEPEPEWLPEDPPEFDPDELDRIRDAEEWAAVHELEREEAIASYQATQRALRRQEVQEKERQRVARRAERERERRATPEPPPRPGLL